MKLRSPETIQCVRSYISARHHLAQYRYMQMGDACVRMASYIRHIRKIWAWHAGRAA